MNDYARASGRSARQVEPVANGQSGPAPQDLSDAAKARIEENKLFVLEHMPELLPIIRDLHASGLIDGWRSVTNCKLTTTP